MQQFQWEYAFLFKESFFGYDIDVHIINIIIDLKRKQVNCGRVLRLIF